MIGKESIKDKIKSTFRDVLSDALIDALKELLHVETDEDGKFKSFKVSKNMNNGYILEMEVTANYPDSGKKNKSNNQIKKSKNKPQKNKNKV